MKQYKTLLNLTLLLASSAVISSYAQAEQTQAEREKLAEKTEVWEPVPASVSTPVGKAPSDAIVLFSGDDLSAWEALKGGEAKWSIGGDVLTVKPGAGDIKTKQNFCDVQLHMEWRTPTQVEGMQGQQRNNSGVFFQQRYEVQVLDSYENPTYANGQAGSVYKQTIPLANAMRPAGEWQYYDIIYTAPRFKGKELNPPGYVTVMHNGVLLQNHTEIQGKTEWIGAPSYEAHGCAPLQLQDHGNLVSFRNIWVREL